MGGPSIPEVTIMPDESRSVAWATHLLTPRWVGQETVAMDLSSLEFTAFSGTGFDPLRMWHRGIEIGPCAAGGDALRYAIAIQQLRDAWLYEDALAATNIVKRFGYDVGTARDRTVVSGKRKGGF